MDLRCKYSSSLGVAVTGSTGFIGSRLIDVFGTDDFTAIPFESIESGAFVVHLAADVSPTRDAMLANVAADTWLLERVNKFHRGLIYASSNNVYPYALDCRIDELQRCNDYYAASKIIGEKIVSDWSKVPTVSVRIADVFGIGQRHGNFFKAIEQALSSGMPLKQYGRGLKRRTYIHVQELAEMLKYIALNSFCSSGRGSALNLGYADSASVSEILDMVAMVSGSEIVQVPIDLDNSDTDIRSMHTSTLYGYKPRWVSFRAALEAYVHEAQPENAKR